MTLRRWQRELDDLRPAGAALTHGPTLEIMLRDARWQLLWPKRCDVRTGPASHFDVGGAGWKQEAVDLGQGVVYLFCEDLSLVT